jgi:hypothetical protein
MRVAKNLTLILAIPGTGVAIEGKAGGPELVARTFVVGTVSMAPSNQRVEWNMLRPLANVGTVALAPSQ